MSTALPQWMYPPRDGGWEAGDLDLLPPEAPRHIELLDGALIVRTASPPLWHNRVLRRLADALEGPAPEGWTVAAGMTVTLGRRSCPEPDVVVATVPYAPERTSFLPEDVALVVEVVSAESQDRDRRYKPGLYVDAGIRHLWRIEEEEGLPVVHAYELDDTTRVYVATGVHRDRFATTVPLHLDIKLADLAR